MHLTAICFHSSRRKTPQSTSRRLPKARRFSNVKTAPTVTRPPLYTNNKLTVASGYTPPSNHPFRNDIMQVSVGTDPNLALKTRKGTGLYKFPSLRGVWYRGGFGHDGSVTSRPPALGLR